MYFSMFYVTYIHVGLDYIMVFFIMFGIHIS